MDKYIHIAAAVSKRIDRKVFILNFIPIAVKKMAADNLERLS
jgi:hypothetical protein